MYVSFSFSPLHTITGDLYTVLKFIQSSLNLNYFVKTLNLDLKKDMEENKDKTTNKYGRNMRNIILIIQIITIKFQTIILKLETLFIKLDTFIHPYLVKFAKKVYEYSKPRLIKLFKRSKQFVLEHTIFVLLCATILMFTGIKHYVNVMTAPLIEEEQQQISIEEQTRLDTLIKIANHKEDIEDLELSTKRLEDIESKVWNYITFDTNFEYFGSWTVTYPITYELTYHGNNAFDSDEFHEEISSILSQVELIWNVQVREQKKEQYYAESYSSLNKPFDQEVTAEELAAANDKFLNLCNSYEAPEIHIRLMVVDDNNSDLVLYSIENFTTIE